MRTRKLPRLFVGESSGVTVADIIGFAQEEYKGRHFCAMAVQLENGNLSFVPCEYAAQAEPDSPRPIRLLSTTNEPTCVFEHFLQSMRSGFRGYSFDEIFVESTENWQFVGLKPFRMR
jgi:hypothetical protein